MLRRLAIQGVEGVLQQLAGVTVRPGGQDRRFTLQFTVAAILKPGVGGADVRYQIQKLVP